MVIGEERSEGSWSSSQLEEPEICGAREPICSPHLCTFASGACWAITASPECVCEPAPASLHFIFIWEINLIAASGPGRPATPEGLLLLGLAAPFRQPSPRRGGPAAGAERPGSTPGTGYEAVGTFVGLPASEFRYILGLLAGSELGSGFLPAGASTHSLVKDLKALPGLFQD